MIQYIKAQTATNNLIIKNSIGSDEIIRLSNSEMRWTTNKGKSFSKITVSKGDIYQFEFGKNYAPEMSYEHRGLVIGIKHKLLYVLPIFSYNPFTHKDVYHPVDFPNSKSDLFLLKQSEFNFLNHDSVLKLNDLRTVSINRILYKYKSNISITSDTYKNIEKLVFCKYFPSYHYQYDSMTDEIRTLNEEITRLNEEIVKLKSKNTELEQKIQGKEDNKNPVII